jgi:hypothetical protein
VNPYRVGLLFSDAAPAGDFLSLSAQSAVGNGIAMANVQQPLKFVLHDDGALAQAAWFLFVTTAGQPFVVIESFYLPYLFGGGHNESPMVERDSPVLPANGRDDRAGYGGNNGRAFPVQRQEPIGYPDSRAVGQPILDSSRWAGGLGHRLDDLPRATDADAIAILARWFGAKNAAGYLSRRAANGVGP